MAHIHEEHTSSNGDNIQIESRTIVHNLFIMAKNAIEQLERINSIVDEEFRKNVKHSLRGRFKKLKNLEDQVRLRVAKSSSIGFDEPNEAGVQNSQHSTIFNEVTEVTQYNPEDSAEYFQAEDQSQAENLETGKDGPHRSTTFIEHFGGNSQNYQKLGPENDYFEILQQKLGELLVTEAESDRISRSKPIRITELECDNYLLQLELESCHNTITAKNNEIHKLKRHIEVLLKDTADNKELVDIAFKTIRNDLKQKENIVVQYEAKVAEIQREAKEAREKFLLENESLKNDVKRLECELKMLQEKLVEGQRKNEELENEIKDLQNQINQNKEIERELRELQKHLADSSVTTDDIHSITSRPPEKGDAETILKLVTDLEVLTAQIQRGQQKMKSRFTTNVENMERIIMAKTEKTSAAIEGDITW